MSRGKYSLVGLPKGKEYKFNAYGKEPEPWSKGNYNEATMCDNCDDEGFDRYGYSAFDHDGKFVGVGDGIDRAGWSEMDYLTLQDIPEEHRDSYYYYNR